MLNLSQLIDLIPSQRHDEKSVDSRIEEFGEWVTARIDSIEEHDEFNDRSSGFLSAFEYLEKLDIEHLNFNDSALKISSSIISDKQIFDAEACKKRLENIIDFIYVTTGTTDNNIKCQFAPYLRHVKKWSEYPLIKQSKSGKVSISKKVITDLGQIKKEEVVKQYSKYLAVSIKDSEVENTITMILNGFLNCIFDCGNYQRLVDVIRSLASVDEIGKRSILETFAVFQLRGSSAAKSGHGPENKLRNILEQWGMISGEDFNPYDVTPEAILGLERGDKKTRAYDFVFPYKVTNMATSIFVQSQIYAGDSGSVSHKNVDQIPLSRRNVKDLFPNAIFLEFVDGAGYCTALAGDLKRILSMDDTDSFFQANTVVVNLRRAFMFAKHLYPAELISWILKILLFSGNEETSVESTVKSIYSPGEVERVFPRTGLSKLNCELKDVLIIDKNIRTSAAAFIIIDSISVLAKSSECNHAIIPGKINYGINRTQWNDLSDYISSRIGRENFNCAVDYLENKLGSLRFNC